MRQVETRHNLFISPYCVCRCMKTQFKQSMITFYRRVFKRGSLTRQSSFLSATLEVKCRFQVLWSSCSIINLLVSSWRLTPKQDFLVCFFAGNLLLSATNAGSMVPNVSVPPLGEELSDVGRRDWTTGIELIRTCMATHDTKTYVPPRGFGYQISCRL